MQTQKDSFMLLEPPEANIYLVSCGIHPDRDLTVESYAILKNSSAIYTILPTLQVASFLHRHSWRYHDLSYLYRDGKHRVDIYRNIAHSVVGAASDTTRTCYLTYGHPVFFDQPSTLILEQARERGLSTYICPGISFVDSIIARRVISITSPGLQVLEASSMVVISAQIDPRLHVLIAQIGAFDSEIAQGLMPLARATVSRLVCYLRNFYPADHTITLCDTDADGLKPIFADVPLCTLPLMTEGITYGTSLYLPPVGASHGDP